MAEALVISPATPCARFSLRLPRGLEIELQRVAGFRLDLPINRSESSDGRQSARLGPDEWLLLGERRQAPQLKAELTSALQGHFHSLVDIGDRDASTDVAGPWAPEVINGGCPLDLGEAAFPPAMATRTVLAKAEIVLWRPAIERAYRVECRRSFAPYVRAFLEDVAREFRGG